MTFRKKDLDTASWFAVCLIIVILLLAVITYYSEIRHRCVAAVGHEGTLTHLGGCKIVNDGGDR